MKTLIFDSEIGGHHLEYIDHIYEACGTYDKRDFIFAIPAFDRNASGLMCKNASNVTFRFLTTDELKKTKGGLINRCVRESLLIRELAEYFKVDEIILVNMAPTVPILPLILPNRIKVKGIIYSIYLWAPKQGFRKWIDYVRYKVLSFSRSVSKVFILNDVSSAETLNSSFRTTRFRYLPDPLPTAALEQTTKIKYDLSGALEGPVFLHLGAMSERKGTLDILKAIDLLPAESHFTFIFAGKIQDEIKERFNELHQKVCRKIKIIVIDEFCSFSLFGHLCTLADCILIPYHITSQSSGILGYASKFGVPVIGPANGLIGNLIDRFELGRTIAPITPHALCKAILDFTPYKTDGRYAAISSVEEFQKILLEND